MGENDKTQTTAVVPTRVTGTQIEQWGEREIVRELVSRMMAFHPAAGEVGKSGMLAAAQLSVMIGASPLPGLNEIHIWKDRDGATHVDPGVNYYRRRAREVGGGVRWLPDGKPRPMTLKEKADYGIPEQQPAAICQGIRSDDFDRYWAMGVRFPDIYHIAGAIGIATADVGERAKRGRPPIWSAIKRAEVDLLRQLYPNLEQHQDTGEVVREAIVRLDRAQPGFDDAAAHEASVILFGEDDDWDDDLFDVGVEEEPEEEPVPEPATIDKAVWFDGVLGRIPYYRHVRHIANTLRQLGYGAWDPDKAEEMYAALEAHAQEKADAEAQE